MLRGERSKDFEEVDAYKYWIDCNNYQAKSDLYKLE